MTVPSEGLDVIPADLCPKPEDANDDADQYHLLPVQNPVLDSPDHSARTEDIVH
jgi:hypothetical protein